MSEPARRLAAILAADIVGYSRLLGQDETATLASVRTLRAAIESHAAAHDGRLFKTTGDGFFVAFPSAVQALRCALAIQDAQRESPGALALRIGLHQGEVVPDGDDLLGDGVIIAARLEPLAAPHGIVLSGRVREDAMGKITLDYEDLGTPTLKNISAPIQVYRVRATAPERAPLPLPEKPSLVVLPFQNMSGDPEQDYFADGMVEDITTALSRIAGLFVIARNSAFTYKGKPIDVKQVGRDLGVRYVLEGSVRKAANRVRITAQLIDSASATHLWADRFDGPLDDIFDLQDQVTAAIAGAIEPSLREAEVRRAATKPTANLDAYDLYLRALAHYQESNPTSFRLCLDFLRRSLVADPTFTLAQGLAARAIALLIYFGSIDRSDPLVAEAAQFARSAIRNAKDDPLALAYGSVLYQLDATGLDLSTVAARRSAELNPNSTWAIYALATVEFTLGNDIEALRLYERMHRLSPRDPRRPYAMIQRAGALTLLNRNEEALALCREARQIIDAPLYGWWLETHCLVELGQLDDAHALAAKVRETYPHETIDMLRRRYAATRAALVEAGTRSLQRIGFPE